MGGKKISKTGGGQRKRGRGQDFFKKLEWEPTSKDI